LRFGTSTAKVEKLYPVLYSCTWASKMVLRRIFGPKRDEVIGEWRKLYIDEFNDLYYSLNIFRVIKS